MPDLNNKIARGFGCHVFLMAYVWAQSTSGRTAARSNRGSSPIGHTRGQLLILPRVARLAGQIFDLNDTICKVRPKGGRRERLLERMKLREQRGLDPGAGLVVRPKPIAKRLDHVIGGDTEIRGAVLVFNYLQNGLQHADDCAVRAVFAFGKPTQAVEVTEQFVRAIDEVNDHFFVNVREKNAAPHVALWLRRRGLPMIIRRYGQS